MEFEYDPAKNASNVGIHGLSLSLAEGMDWDAALVRVDLRFKYDEVRMQGLVPMGNTLYFVAFVDRVSEDHESRRIISLRRANRDEVNQYVKSF